ncbi:MAG: preprotein translocase subunit SecA [Eubacteriales bacterium]
MGIFKSSDEKVVKKLYKLVEQINEIEKKYTNYSADELRALTEELKKRLQDGETLDDILCEAFAAVKVAATRTIGQTPYDVQVIGAIVLHQGRIAELKTGEGKTLMSTMAGYLNALSGKGVHLVTVNEYLAKHQSEWMGKIYTYLGLTVGMIERTQSKKEKQEAYNADITYGISSEYGFDYLRDSMELIKEGVVQRELSYVMIDEIDSILIDEARSPLIISGNVEGKQQLYKIADSFVRGLKERPEAPPTDRFAEYDENDPKYKGDFDRDEKASTVALTEEGVVKAEKFFNVENLSDTANIAISHHINQALRANMLMHRDRDYIVKDNRVIIVDQNTGRLREGRRFSDGLHQAIEAKERVAIKDESKTLASITLQNYFRMYKKISGMTATAKTEEEEFRAIYGMDVVVIPTNMPMIRIDEEDAIYTNENAKFAAIIENIIECNQNGQPVLVGTASVEASEKLSNMLKKRKINHNVLNAKNHEREAEIIAQAGRVGKITIATNMAGRGTDIKLGGDPDVMATKDLLMQEYTNDEILIAAGHTKINDERLLELREKYNQLVEKHKKVTDVEHVKVVEAGGLRVIGSERHESRRIDNQLRGRSGRQGDPGSSKFYIALEDPLIRLYTKGREGFVNMLQSIEMDDGYLGEHKFITKTIERAQKAAESNSFAARKNVLQYDDVINEQRKIIYSQRREVLVKEDLSDSIKSMIEYLVSDMVDLATADSEYPEEWDFDKLLVEANNLFLSAGWWITKKDEKIFKNVFVKEYRIFVPKEKRENMTREQLKEFILKGAMKIYNTLDSHISSMGLSMRDAERSILLSVVNYNWQNHMEEAEQLKQGIGLRSYGQRNPLIEYKIETGDMFDNLVHVIKIEAARTIYRSNLVGTILHRKALVEALEKKNQGIQLGPAQSSKPKSAANQKVGRNDPCPCGSGKKYKKCCGQ